MSLEDRIENAEQALQPVIPGGVEELTIRVCYEETFFDADGQRCQRSIPAEYDYSTPFPPPHWNPVKGCLTTMRVLYPIGDPDSPSSVNEEND